MPNFVLALTKLDLVYCIDGGMASLTVLNR
jgi:hypothetical protein